MSSQAFRFLENAFYLGSTFAVFMKFKMVVADAVMVTGKSMQPTLNPDGTRNMVLVNRMAVHPKRGELVVLRFADLSPWLFIPFNFSKVWSVIRCLILC
jgi:signal peptidase I